MCVFLLKLRTTRCCVILWRRKFCVIFCVLRGVTNKFEHVVFVEGARQMTEDVVVIGRMGVVIGRIGRIGRRQKKRARPAVCISFY